MMEGFVDTDEKGLVRDLNSKALLCTNNKAYEEYKRNLEQKKTESERLNNLEKELQGIRNLLLQVLDKE
jgi:uncharacterized protein YhaN